MKHDDQVLELQHIMGNGLLVLSHIYRKCTDAGIYARAEVLEMHRLARRLERALRMFNLRKFGKGACHG